MFEKGKNCRFKIFCYNLLLRSGFVDPDIYDDLDVTDCYLLMGVACGTASRCDELAMAGTAGVGLVVLAGITWITK